MRSKQSIAASTGRVSYFRIRYQRESASIDEAAKALNNYFGVACLKSKAISVQVMLRFRKSAKIPEAASSFRYRDK